MNNNDEKFWLDDFVRSFKTTINNQYNGTKNVNQILNTISLISVISFILMIIFNVNCIFLIIPIFIILFTIYFNYFKKTYTNEKFSHKRPNYHYDNISYNPELSNILNTISEITFYSLNKTDNSSILTNCKTILNDNIPASNADEEVICNNNTLHIDKNMFLDNENLLEKRSFERQFYDNPLREPLNDQKDFAEWIYKGTK